jgi:hypothetical protein
MVTNSFGNKKFHSAYEKAQHALMRCQIFFFWGPGRDFLFFDPSSQCVSIMLPSGSPISHMVYPEFKSHLYKMKRWAVVEHACFHFATGPPIRCFFWGVPEMSLSPFLAWANTLCKEHPTYLVSI